MKAIKVLVLGVGLSGCIGTRHTVTESHERDYRYRLDSIAQRVEVRVKPITVPQSTAMLQLTEAQLGQLPQGASYTSSNGRATGTVTRNANGFKFEANCDSLTVLVETMNRELYHLRVEKDSLLQQSAKVKTITVREPSGWQWFQIWGFRLLLAAAVIYVTLKKIDLWQAIKAITKRLWSNRQ